MNLEISRYALRIVPQDSTVIDRDERDLAFIEEVLGLRNEGDSVRLVRRNAHGLNCIAYLETVSSSFEEGGE